MIPSINPWDAEIELFEQLTLARLLKHTEPEGKCLAWTGHANLGRSPQIRLGGAKGRAYNVRRVLWVLTRGSIRADRVVTVDCDCELCVHPDCLIAVHQSKLQKGQPKSLLASRRIATAQRRRSPITEEMVREIRGSTIPAVEFDRRWGLGAGTSAHIRSGARRAPLGLGMLGGVV